MSISQKTPEGTLADQISCPQCSASLPLSATFCGFCGARLQKEKQAIDAEGEDTTGRYRITTLVRRHPQMNLYFAQDTRQAQEPGQARMVAIRDIDITSLGDKERERARELAQQEYDDLRYWHIPHTLACIDLYISQGHLFLVSGLPMPAPTAMAGSTQRLYTLQDFLQSGLGVPRETRTLEWMRNLCQAVESLHRHGLVLGDLDPYTVVLDKNSAQAEPYLMACWLLPALQEMLVPVMIAPTPHVSYFKAPEALAGKAAARSDVYSLGALLYLLLTGTPPDESTLRHRRRLRTPREINSRINQSLDECVMQALAIRPEERFASVQAFMAALENARSNQPPRKTFASATQAPKVPVSDMETVRIVPLSQKDVARWRALREEKAGKNIYRREDIHLIDTIELTERQNLPPGMARQSTADKDKQATILKPPPNKEVSPRSESRASENRTTPPPARQRWPQRITGTQPEDQPSQKQASTKGKKAAANGKQSTTPPQNKNEGELSLLKQIQRLLLGKKQQAIEAAAIIETPMRIRPDQPYNLRLHIMGRDEPTLPPTAKKGMEPAGLSALIHGDIVLVEVRSVLQQGYTYVLQQATVTIPADGYAAEVTIPMQQQPLSTTGRRDRLHIFFLDEHRQPLYEKPFVVEIFVSPLVQFGREGHQVLTIPI
jgi:serine/threonine protein kinase